MTGMDTVGAGRLTKEVPMYVVMNTLRMQAEHAPHITQAFRGSDEHMKQIAGCIDFKLLREAKGEGEPVFIAMTIWEDEESFRDWMQSADFRNAHANTANSAAQGEVHQYEVVVGG